VSAQARYATSRGKLGSPIVVDSESRRPVLVCLREVRADETAAGTAADEAAMRMARIIAQALNRVDAEERWRKGQGDKG